MANTSTEEVIQRLRELLENNARIDIRKNNDTSSTISGKGVKFNILQPPPNNIARNISRLR